MQSSTGTLFRGVIMVICLVLIPLAALFGDRVRDAAKDYVVEQWTALTEKWGGGPSQPTSSAPVPPLFGQANGLPGGSSPGPQTFAPRWPEQPPAGNPSLLGAVPPGAMPAFPAHPAGAQGPAAGMSGLPQQAPPPGAFPQNALPTPSAMPSGMPSGAVPASYEEQVSAPPSPGLPPAALGAGAPNGLAPMSEAAPLAPPASPGHEDRLRQYQNRLRELGVVYYLLETWGDRGQLFRFYCRVGLAGNATCTHYFDAVDAEPLVAMGKVIQQVERWRASGQ